MTLIRNPRRLLILVLACPLLAYPQNFNFRYHVDGLQDPTLIQVFDDGQRTYVQSGLEDPPRLFRVPRPGTGNGLIKWRFESPYLVIDEVLNCFQGVQARQDWLVHNDKNTHQPCTRPTDPVPEVSAFTPPIEASLPLTGSPPLSTRPIVFEVKDGERLSQALTRFLTTQGYLLDWKSPDDFLVREGYVTYGRTLEETLSGLPQEFGLTLDIRLNRVLIKRLSSRQSE